MITPRSIQLIVEITCLVFKVVSNPLSNFVKTWSYAKVISSILGIFKCKQWLPNSALNLSPTFLENEENHPFSLNIYLRIWL